MKKNTKIMIVVGIALILLVGVVGITFAYLSTGGSQEQANTFTSGCLSISLTNESNSINLTSAYPISDIEGLETTSYDFTITNNCSSQAKYQINLESLNEVANTLNAEYLKVSLSSDSVGNVISKLSDNVKVTPALDGAYQSHNLYTDSLEANGSKTYHLKLWIDYDATKEQAASKTYTSKINVIANPETSVIDNLEATYELNDKTLTANLTNNVTSATYCTTTDNICVPSTNANIANNSFNIELQANDNKQMACTKLNGTSKIICSDPSKISLCPEGATACNTILAGRTEGNRGDLRSAFSEDTTGKYFTTTDWDGTTYYFAGNPSDNWVKFAGFYWRIIRINGDGSIRLIYQGTSANTTGTGTQIGTSTYSINSSTYKDNAYVGYMYTLNQVHGTGTESGIKKVVDDWYETNIADKGYSSHVDTNAGFCNDRTSTTTNGGAPNDTGGTGTTGTYYGARYRLYSNKTPTFECSDRNNDLFTVSSSNKGNKKLTYPVGLITADEVAYAGGVWNTSNNSYYLYTNSTYWTMSPYLCSGSAHVFGVYSSGNLLNIDVNYARGVRPVINLKADTTYTGTGTSTVPYSVV